jgi:hypothetical protein
MNKITIDMSEFNNTSECELTVIKPNGVIIQFPKVYISDTYYNVKPHKEYCRDRYGFPLLQHETKLIDEISGEFNFIPLIDDDGVQYREIREVKV